MTTNSIQFILPHNWNERNKCSFTTHNGH